MAYVIEYRTKALAVLQALPKRTRALLMATIEELTVNPEPEGSELVEQGGEWVHLWSVGRFLIAYEIHDRRLVIVVLSVTKDG